MGKLVESAEDFLCQMKVFYHRNSSFKQKLFQTLKYTLLMLGQISVDFHIWANLH